MSPLELKRALGLPENLDARRINAHALRKHCAGGDELLAAKEWAGGFAGDGSAHPGVSEIGAEMLRRLKEIERALLDGIERTHKLPPGSLTDHV